MNASKSTDNESLFLPKPQGMLDALTDADQLLVGFTPFSANPVEITFDVRGFGFVVEELRAVCS